VDVKPGHSSNPNDLKFTWHAIEQTEKSLTLQLEFETPILVSSNDALDFMQVTFNDPLLFFSLKGGLIREKHRLI